jgi:MFS family permease
METVMGATPLQVVAWFVPMALGGCIISAAAGFLLHLLPGTIMILISGAAWIIAPLLFAIAPAGANYWAFVFPAMICATTGIDITFNITNVFITTSFPRHRQGLAGALINSILHLGISFFLGLSDIIATYSRAHGLARSWKNVFWFEVSLAAAALAILVLFVKIDKAKSDLTVDERMELEVEAASKDASTKKARRAEELN